MKSKRIGFSIITLMLSLICGLGFISMPKEKVNASATQSATYNQYMLVDDGDGEVEPKQVALNRQAGGLSINGEPVESGTDSSYEFVLGEKDIVLQATTNPGYLLKGWYIVFVDNTEVVPGTNDGYIAIGNAEQKINNDYISVGTFVEPDKKANLTILEMSDSVKVAPVFDYEYYNVYLKGINGVTEIAQANVKYDDKVQISRVVDSNVNIDAISMISSQIDFDECENHTTEAGHLNSCINKYNFVKDSTGRTTKFEVVFQMSVFEDVTVELNYDRLYQVDLKLFLNDTELTNTAVEDEEFDRIFSCVNLTKDKVGTEDVNRYFAKLSDTSYFVKTGANFEISVMQNYKNANGYVLYNFSSLDKSTSNMTANYNSLSVDRVDDNAIEIRYTYNTFKVEFKGVDYMSDKTVQVNKDIVVSETKELTVVNNVLDLTACLEENVGYTYWGFVKFDKSKSIYDDDDKITSFTLNVDEPKDVVIYVLYTKTAYTINLTKLTDVKLTNTAGDFVYPVASAKIGETTKTGTTISFDGFNIGDEITLELTLNAGFNVSAVTGMTKENGKQVYSLTLDKAFLTGKDETINLELVAELLKYTLTYRIAKYEVSASVHSMADIWFTENNYVENLSSDGKYYEIVVEDLTYYQTLTLNAKANETGTVNDQNKKCYFVFRRFTTDFKTAITDGLDNVDNEEGTPSTYFIPFTIYGNSIVYVVYTQPTTQMEIQIKSAPESAGIGFVVRQVDTADALESVEGLYELSQNKEVTLAISGLVGNENLFGYKFKNVELYKAVVSSSGFIKDSTSATEFKFTPNSDDLYIVVVNIEVVKYQVNLTANINGIKVESGYDDEISFEMSVENTAIEFEKLLGYYVKRVQVKNADNSKTELSKMNQSNGSRNGEVVGERNYFSTYYYNFSIDKEGQEKSEFQKFIETYLRTVEIDGSTKVEPFDLIFTFETYKYEVALKYVKFNNSELDEKANSKLQNPMIELSYKFTSDPEEEATTVNDYNATAVGITFVGIPYGVNISLNVVRGVSAGFEIVGWCDYYTYSGIKSSLVNENEQKVKYDLNSISKDFKIAYRVDFVEYTIKLQYSDEMGNPSLLVNNENKSKVKVGDLIEITTNARLEKGYLFSHFEYIEAQYNGYDFVDDATFENDYQNLYIIDKGYVCKNISNIYNGDYKYYTLTENMVSDNSKTFEDDDFDASKYVAENNVVSFNLVYVPVSMTIQNVSSTIEKLDGVGNKIADALDLESVGLTVADLATYTISAKSGGATRPVVENETIVTVNDTITVNIQINKNAVSSLNGNKYDLSKGLTLYLDGLRSAWEEISVDSLGGGAYEFSFLVSQNINNVIFATEKDETSKIVINYGYQMIGDKTVAVTTNMAKSNEFNSKVSYKITGKLTLVGPAKEDAATGMLAQSNPFLQQVKIELNLEKSLSDYFVVNSITAYKGLGVSEQNKITSLSSYFISVETKTMSDTHRVVVDYVDLTMYDSDITICFNVQPRIYIEQQEVTTQNEKLIIRDYQFEVVNGVIEGKAQNITLGANKDLYNIAGYGIDPSIMEIKVMKDGSNVEKGAINVGEYYLKLVFKEKYDNGNEIPDEVKMKSWLFYIKELPCKIKLKINPLVVKMEAKATKFDKVYDASSSYDLSLETDETELTSKDKNITIYGLANGKDFDLGMLSFTKGKAEIVVYNEKDELVSQKYVTNGSHAHILITGMNLINNQNFNFKFEEYAYYVDEDTTETKVGLLVKDVVNIVPKIVEIENLEVYDKVYNKADPSAEFGLAEGKTEYIINFTYTDDSEVKFLAEEVKVYFANNPFTKDFALDTLMDGEVGENKYIIIDARNALGGDKSENYVFGEFGTGIINYKERRTIYPNKLTTTIKGVGNVSVVNERGKNDHTKAGLIPVDSTLSVERIEPNSAGYREIQDSISSFLSRRNVFAAGYRLSIVDKNGIEMNVSNELYLHLPNEKELVNVLSLSGDRAKSVDFDIEGGNVVIDLKQIDEDITYFVLIQNRALLKAWQIVLIVVLSLVAAAGIGVAVFFIVRKRRLKNERYDKI